MSHVEAFDRSRRAGLAGSLVSFAAWQGLALAARLVEGSRAAPLRGALTVASLAGWLAWCVSLVAMVRWQSRVRRDPAASVALNDEFVQRARLKAAAVGLAAVLAIQVVPLAANMPGEAAGQLTILVGVTATIGAFLFFQRG